MRRHVVIVLRELLKKDILMHESEAREVVDAINGKDSITLDFSGIAGVGDGFLRELFAVWHKENPSVTFNIVSASSSVADAIEDAFKIK